MVDKKNQPSSIESILKKASEEIGENRCNFKVDNDLSEETFNNSAYGSNELAEYINFDMIGEEDGNGEAFGHLIKNSNYEDLTGDRNVLKILLDSGIGQIVPENSIVLIHYIAYIPNIHEPFDVTYLQGKRPKRFTLSNYELLPGLEIGIKTMRMGENARFIIKPKLAYRELGCPPRIPPNSSVLFDVHLVKYFSPENYTIYDEDNRDPERFRINLNKVIKLHAEGNELYKRKNILEALYKYNIAKELLHITGCNNEKEEIEMMKHLNRLYTNLSLCYIKKCSFNKVCSMGSEAIRYSNKFSKHNVKLFYNWGKALRLLKQFTEAKYKLNKALKLEPNNATIQYELQKLEQDRLFNSNVESLASNNTCNDSKCLPSEFWDIFNNHLTKFINGEDDVLTITLVKDPNDIELIKRKASVYNLKCHVVTKAGGIIDCIAIQKVQDSF